MDEAKPRFVLSARVSVFLILLGATTLTIPAAAAADDGSGRAAPLETISRSSAADSGIALRAADITPLPPSPVFGSFAGGSEVGYSVTLQDGQMMYVSVTFSPNASGGCFVREGAPEVFFPTWGSPAEETGVDHRTFNPLTMYSECWQSGNYWVGVGIRKSSLASGKSFVLTYSIHDSGDMYPPGVGIVGDLQDRWRRRPFAIDFYASDAPGRNGVSSGVSRIEYTYDGATWKPGAAVLISREGKTRVGYRAVDGAGNVGGIREFVGGVDSRRPTALARGKVFARRGSRVKLPFLISDPKPGSGGCGVWIEVKRRNLTVVKTTRKFLEKPGKGYFLTRIRLKPGDYRYFVYAQDRAGNRSRLTKVSSDPLIVR